jgi:predicted nucleic acid-binding protein
MDYAYFDTSALVKRYVDELGRREVLTLLRKNQCVVSAVLPLEVRSALRRRVTEKTVDAKRVFGILKRLAADRAYWTIIEVSPEVLATAESLSGAHPLRALDAIHVASAKLFADRTALQTFTFVSADIRQTNVAEALGIKTRYIRSGKSRRGDSHR